jgi:hypothetical protein
VPVAVLPKNLKLHLGRFSFVLHRNKPQVPLTNELNGMLTFLRNLIQQPDSWAKEITPSSIGVDPTSFSIPGADMGARESYAMHQVDPSINNLHPTTRALFGESFNVLGVSMSLEFQGLALQVIYWCTSHLARITGESTRYSMRYSHVMSYVYCARMDS